MEEKVSVTVLNSQEEIALLVDEVVTIQMGEKQYLPARVYTKNGDFMGCLGVNAFTTRPGTIGSPQLFDILETHEIQEAIVAHRTNHASQQIVLEVRLQEKERVVVA